MTRAGNGEGNGLRCGVRKIAECNPHTSASRREHFFGLCPVDPLQTTFLRGNPSAGIAGAGLIPKPATGEGPRTKALAHRVEESCSLGDPILA
jgi:hypothetical protein